MKSVLSSALIIVLVSLTLCASTRATSVAVPSYFYPGSNWTTLEQSSPTVALTVINPNNGPVCSATDTTNYQNQVAEAQGKGIVVLGYVSTRGGTRSWYPYYDDYNVYNEGVYADIDLYFNTFHVDGIFLDEGPGTGTWNSPLPAYQDFNSGVWHSPSPTTETGSQYYTPINQKIKSEWAGTSSKGMIVLNPGGYTDEGYVNVADTLCIFESTYSNYLTWMPPSWVAHYDPSRFWHMVHTLPSGSITAVQDVVNHAKLSTVRGGYLYATDLPLNPNPYQSLPSSAVWNEETECAQALYHWRAWNDVTKLNLAFNFNHTWNYKRIYLDTDRNAGTGFQVNGIGADDLIENGVLYYHTGSGSSWTWTKVAGASVTTTSSANSVQYSFPRSAIGLQNMPASEDLVFQVWRTNATNSADNKTVNTQKYTHVFNQSDANIQQYHADNDSTALYYYAVCPTNYTYKDIMIDADNSAATGYQTGGIGADYLIENGTLYQHTGSSTSWTWNSLGSANMLQVGNAYSWSIRRTKIGLTNLDLNPATMLWSQPAVIFQGSGGGTTITEPAFVQVISD